MKVFISWSGDKSRNVAVALRDWLPSVINCIQPFVSSKDIHAGTRWQQEIADQLDTTNFGVVCVTKENQLSPWLNFEAGALAKAVDLSRVVPLAIDLKPSDVKIPLGQFQAQPASEHGLGEIVTSMNATAEAPLTEPMLKKAVAKWWPDLDEELQTIDREHTNRSTPARAPGEPQPRNDRELLEEMLNAVRSLARTDAQLSVSTSHPLLDDHPLPQELTALLIDSGCDARVVRSRTRRRVSIESSTGIPAVVRNEIHRLAAIYDVPVDYFAVRAARRLASLDDPEVSATPRSAAAKRRAVKKRPNENADS